MASITLEIIAREDTSEFGEDTPWEYTARVACGRAEDAIALLRDGLGGGEELSVFNIEADGLILKFLSFDNAEVGRIFGIDSTLASARQAAKDQAIISNELERLTQRAIIEIVPNKPIWLRCDWWENVHPDPDQAPLFDSVGCKIEVGQRCLFRREPNQEWGEGWVKQIGAHSERPIGVWEMNIVSAGGFGCRPTDVKIIHDRVSINKVMTMVKDRVCHMVAEPSSAWGYSTSEDPELRALLARYRGMVQPKADC